MKLKIYVIITLFSLAVSAFSQTTWKRKDVVEPPLQLFNSTDVFNLPTAETLQKGDYYFSIAHKFSTPISEGVHQLFGFDGSAIMRIALGYAITDNLLIKLGRSNLYGNYDLSLKYKTLELRNETLPTLVTLLGGIVYNTKALPEPEDKSRLWQFYGHIVINSKIGESIGIGLVPSMLINSRIDIPENYNSFTMGAYIQYFMSKNWSIFVEANPTYNGWRKNYDSYNFVLELVTGGHFFKLVLGNNQYLNTENFMAGATDSFESGKLHIGFLISRNL
jgi:hypothetical protein